MLKFLPYFSVTGFSNCYLLGPKDGGEAFLIDPGIFDEGLLNLIENNGYYIKTVLITHAHHSHTNGIKTLLKIYDAEVFCSEPNHLGFPARSLPNTKSMILGDFTVDVLPIPGHSKDSVCYRIDRLLFTGDSLTAGKIGSTESEYEQTMLISALHRDILSLDADTLIFPGHGPPTNLSVEKAFNPHLRNV